MLNNVNDFLVVLVVFVLLMAGQKDVGNTAKSIGRFIGELKKRQEEFRTELMRELNSASLEDEKVNIPTKYVKSVNNTNNDEKVKEIEMKIRQLQEELKRLKNDGGKN
ncbi:hypothetical protein BFU36_03315 [Sulfolobus sp. A20]|uniref:twin-arginine translocase TatA/TatE family subunit n=1 Tax=Saccharolobus sp. A20 TaxID=1891280 RepID=UPI000846089F|nr:twin-arginine translocase TatA/TatE family subunit [Sulfolobus sp. A20]TRM77839.1 hypothetical protein DJ528_05900 [Sulfolobus sp. B5]TRM78561.1 hypothetical protein DJ532_00825 [Sulfolobus sp. A20-N-F8]TRM79178.1 hypothetical protein DJ524_09945 [Sulfolobus sp. D5]TRM83177.1 hypothetical protein DJ531_06695 [Sulfolobus sp. A20-N-F6]TRM86051.1 hypothetical protein DJ521_06425 [Sulfolobus sp. E3]TRM86559.1 hypothetical protein DJ529_11030 [Sulfolobus sp. C3]TRN00692.1 hypothetical protein 